MKTPAMHYDAAYFSWQQSIGEFGGWAHQSTFAPHILPTDTVLDFGCGGGYVLKNLTCAKRLGVEINATARITAANNGVEVYETSSQLPDECADKIISNNALEHTKHPLQELMALHPKLRQGGKAIFIVPCESVSYAYDPDDINKHLYSWSPMCIGNLFTEAGFRVLESRPYIHKWPPLYQTIARIGGRQTFDLACRLYGHLARHWFQVRVIAER